MWHGPKLLLLLILLLILLLMLLFTLGKKREEKKNYVGSAPLPTSIKEKGKILAQKAVSPLHRKRYEN